MEHEQEQEVTKAESGKKTWGKHLVGALLAVVILGVVFLLGFVGVNVVMNLATGHGKEVMVPDITNKNFNVARQQCEKLELYVQDVESTFNAEIEKGRIISQKPLPNTKTKKSRTIEVVVSLGPKLLTIPPLDNLSVEEARLRLENAGFKAGKITSRYSNVVVADKVISHYPRNITEAPQGSSIDLLVSLGQLSNNSRKDYLKMLDTGKTAPEAVEEDSLEVPAQGKYFDLLGQ